MATQTKIPPLTVSNPWWGHDPSDKQWLGLYAYEECLDLFYGGAAGPGKTSFLLMAAVQYVHYPHYRALILRKTYADLSLPDAIMDRAISWWDGVEGARFNNQEKVCYSPSGAKITFGYLASVRDHLRYQGAAVHLVGIDEASQIPSRQLEYLHSRIRKAPLLRVDPPHWPVSISRMRFSTCLVACSAVVICSPIGGASGCGLVVNQFVVLGLCSRESAVLACHSPGSLGQASPLIWSSPSGSTSPPTQWQPRRPSTGWSTIRSSWNSTSPATAPEWPSSVVRKRG